MLMASWISGANNDRESFETGSEFQSNDRTAEAPFVADLLHPYFKESRMLGVRDVAVRLRVCTATVYKLCASGALEHVRVLNAIRVPEEALRAFVMDRHTVHRAPR